MPVEETLNPKRIVDVFGQNSAFYKKLSQFIQKVKENNTKVFDKKYEEWKSIFSSIYNIECNENLFLKHCYYCTTLFIFLVVRISIKKGADVKEAYKTYISKNYDKLSSPILQTFEWVNIDQETFHQIYRLLFKAHIEKEDLFHYYYQDIIRSSIRHSTGEFYTPSNLVKKMVKNSYEFGMKILDPACGSGNFIMEIISRIIESHKSDGLKYQAIENIFGFDINPLAIFTLKINALIILDEYMPNINMKKLKLNFHYIDSLFPQNNEFKKLKLNQDELLNSFDLIIGNPPWLTYKDLKEKTYQEKIRNLAEKLNIKPKSQYITHIELAAIFFYAIPTIFSKSNGIIFFVATKSLINGDHCKKFRAFWKFENIEIWDFSNNSCFNIDHICLKAQYTGNKTKDIQQKYPILAKIFDENLNITKETEYSSLKIEKDGALVILPKKDIEYLSNIQYSQYKKRFYQGATLVPRNLVFFEINSEENNILSISSSKDILSRSKKKWRFQFKNKKIEKDFRFKTFLNKDLVPFFLKRLRDVFLPIDKENYKFKTEYLKSNPLAYDFYKKMNHIYEERKKSTSDIETLFSNLNYWNKLTKQTNTSPYLVVYNASGSYLKSAVIEQFEQKIIVDSENYYYSTEQKNEAYYLTAIFNTPLITKYIKLIKSSRHIHKRPFSFPIPFYDEKNKDHYKLAQKGKKYTSYVHDLVYNNPKITSQKIRLILNKNLLKLDPLTKKVVFE
ncbi:MAG: SAM-dependent methyltransferase [Promethearchaeota archaeon]|jgi:methylase of polypeptide subunit release factors|nr:MAG: SAM-dependent methyltransferase [Candidatus Lokiarchaeota archaeon]